MRNWFTGSALWAIVGAAAVMAIYGHFKTLGPLLGALASLITIGVEVYCARAAVHFRNSASTPQRAMVVTLMVICAIVSVLFEHRGIETINSEANAEYARAFSEQREALEIKAALESDYNSLPALPRDPAELATMNTRALNRIEAVRGNWEATPYAWGTDRITQLEALNRARAVSARPLPQQLAQPLSDAAIWFIVAFVLLMRVFGFWSIAPNGGGAIRLVTPEPAPEKTPPPVKPGAALVEARWAKKRAADPTWEPRRRQRATG